MSLIGRIFPGSRTAREVERRKAAYEVEHAKRVEHVARAMVKRDADRNSWRRSAQSWEETASWRQIEWLQLAEAAIAAVDEFDR